jgi:hypothetical protein
LTELEGCEGLVDNLYDLTKKALQEALATSSDKSRKEIFEDFQNGVRNLFPLVKEMRNRGVPVREFFMKIQDLAQYSNSELENSGNFNKQELALLKRLFDKFTNPLNVYGTSLNTGEMFASVFEFDMQSTHIYPNAWGGSRSRGNIIEMNAFNHLVGTCIEDMVVLADALNSAESMLSSSRTLNPLVYQDMVNNSNTIETFQAAVTGFVNGSTEFETVSTSAQNLRLELETICQENQTMMNLPILPIFL